MLPRGDRKVSGEYPGRILAYHREDIVHSTFPTEDKGKRRRSVPETVGREKVRGIDLSVRVRVQSRE